MVGFPLLLIPLAIYNIIVFLMPEVSFTDPLVKVTLMSGAEWAVSLSDVLLTLSILLLLAEVIKGARPGAKYLTDHLLSLLVFGAAAAEFVLWPKFGTSTYFLMTALSLVDFLSGLALRTRRRAVAVTPAPAPKGAEKVEAPVAEPKIEPAPAAPPAAAATATPAAPAAASVAESVLKDHPEPKPVPPAPTVAPEAAPVASDAAPPKTPSPEATSHEASSPEVPSPGLQPGSGPTPSPDKPDTPQR
ncbi:hypothetical protein ACH79_12500 [Bradyrhizobium sp. CCBAU 051011]|uniref:hypothetical protein n=1 Tax=Bradyrhizobium sp. CCBAU 051011 TaxID=858422 RepID=UPI0013741815|nr:hypothetical protein [Bradyrhizobium sp. CCBAU 051011]QHO73351.1 hypothetical protein ACH79_12500 [Bradyrhizobium sp. CCBAU 051011]